MRNFQITFYLFVRIFEIRKELQKLLSGILYLQFVCSLLEKLSRKERELRETSKPRFSNYSLSIFLRRKENCKKFPEHVNLFTLLKFLEKDGVCKELPNYVYDLFIQWNFLKEGELREPSRPRV